VTVNGEAELELPEGFTTLLVVLKGRDPRWNGGETGRGPGDVVVSLGARRNSRTADSESAESRLERCFSSAS
jgi:hypothetical protein